MSNTDSNVLIEWTRYNSERTATLKLLSALQDKFLNLSEPEKHFISEIEFTSCVEAKKAICFARLKANNKKEFVSGYTHILKYVEQWTEMFDLYFTFLYNNQEYLSSKIYKAMINLLDKETIVINDQDTVDWLFNDELYEWQYQDQTIWRRLDSLEIQNTLLDIRRVRFIKPFQTIESKESPVKPIVPIIESKSKVWQYNYDNNWVDIPETLSCFFNNLGINSVFISTINDNPCIVDLNKMSILNTSTNVNYHLRVL